MRREIGEIPAVVGRALAADDERLAVVAAIEAARPRWVMIAGRGTSDHAAVYAQYLIEAHLGLPTGLVKPSVTTVYGATLDWRGGMVLAISQSGRSPDIVAVVEAARASGALTVAITNEPASPLAAVAELELRCHAGPELAVPATKTYVAELVVLAALVADLRSGGEPGQSLRSLPDVLQGTIGLSEAWLEDAGRPTVAGLVAADRALLVSRGYNLATALELALKLKETCGLYAEAYSTADFAHGPKALTRPDVPIIAIRPDGPMGAAVDETLDGVHARGATAAVIGGREAQEIGGALVLPDELPEELTPMTYVVAGQLLVEAVARGRGLDPDAPSDLSKVTLTR
ncbi:MAG TPA: SIS domain-containing protein [Candidatus Limnocylindria bacterium]